MTYLFPFPARCYMRPSHSKVRRAMDQTEHCMHRLSSCTYPIIWCLLATRSQWYIQLGVVSVKAWTIKNKNNAKTSGNRCCDFASQSPKQQGFLVESCSSVLFYQMIFPTNDSHAHFHTTHRLHTHSHHLPSPFCVQTLNLLSQYPKCCGYGRESWGLVGVSIPS